jgi:hypothetical protein
VGVGIVVARAQCLVHKGILHDCSIGIVGHRDGDATPRCWWRQERLEGSGFRDYVRITVDSGWRISSRFEDKRKVAQRLNNSLMTVIALFSEGLAYKQDRVAQCQVPRSAGWRNNEECRRTRSDTVQCLDRDIWSVDNPQERADG